MISFTKYILEKIVFMLFIKIKKPSLNYDELIIIDTFFLVNNILNDKHYHDPYFKGLDSVLINQNKSFVYLPVLVGDLSLLNIF